LILLACASPDSGQAAIAELERCHKAGAVGVGELSDKAGGWRNHHELGIHIDDPLMDPSSTVRGIVHLPLNISRR